MASRDLVYLPFYLAILIPVFLIITIPVRILARKVSDSVPLTLFLFPVSFIIGTIMFYLPVMQSANVVTRIAPELLTGTYLPVYIFFTIYNTDYYIFMRSLPQVIIISIVIFNGMTIVLGILLRDILHHHLNYVQSIIAVLVCVTIQPNNIIVLLKNLSKYKYLGIMLEIESLLTIIPVMYSTQFAFGYLEKIQSKWYQFLSVFIRYHVVSLILGYIVGKITAKLMAYFYNIPKSVVTISIGMSFLTYFLAENIIFTSGPLAIILVSLEVKLERHRFTIEVENCMTCFWGILSYKWEKVFLMLLGVITTHYFWQFFLYRKIFGSVITFFCANLARIVTFIILYPIMNIFRYNIDVKCLIVLGWSGVKGSVNLMIIYKLITTESTSPIIRDFFLEFMVYTYLSIFLNSATIKFVVSLLGMSELSSTRKSNMNNCMQFIMQRRINNINFYKLNKHLCSVNWALVRKETVVVHPYRTKANEEDKETYEEKEEIEFLSGSLVCPECVKEVPYDVTEQEIKEMINEARIKILKAKKVSIMKQYENGVINKNCVEILVYTFELMIESHLQKTTVNVESYLKKNKFLETIYYILSVLNMETIHEPPDSLFNRLCFYIVMHKAYNYFIWAYCVLYVFIFSIYMEPVTHPYLFVYAVATVVLFSIEVILKALALSRNNIILHGLTCYYKFKWNIFDFILLTISCYDLMCIFWVNLGYIEVPPKLYVGFYIGEVRLLSKMLVLLHPLYSALLVAIEQKIDSKICFGYDLATGLVNCCDEVLMIIGHIVEVNAIKSYFVKQLQLEKFELIRIMEEVQSERPYIAITVKTKQAIRTTLSAMEDSLNDLKVSGFVDNVEYVYIFKEIFDKQKFLRNIKFVQTIPPKLLFFEVPWMKDDIVKEYLHRHAVNVFWNKGQIVCKDGQSLQGIYVFVGGFLKLKYTPKSSTIENIKSFGMLPIVDYYGSFNFQEGWEDRIAPGNSVGELSLLTGRPYDCIIVAESPSHGYFLSAEVVHHAMKLSKNPVNGLQARMWKWSTINMAVAILTNLPLYQMMTQEQIKFKLQRAFMPNLSCYKMFVITDMMDDVILMEGMAADYNYGNIFIAPMLLPRSTQKLILPKSSYLDLDDDIIVKLLVIPVEDAEETEIMIEEEQLADLGGSLSSSCLLQVQPREKLKMHKKSKNIEPLLTKESYYSTSMFDIDSKDKFEVLEPGPSASIPTTISDVNTVDKLNLLTMNKTVFGVETSEEDML